MSTLNRIVNKGTSTTPPPSPVSAPRKPAINEPTATNRVKTNTLIVSSALTSVPHVAGTKYCCLSNTVIFSGRVPFLCTRQISDRWSDPWSHHYPGCGGGLFVVHHPSDFRSARTTERPRRSEPQGLASVAANSE